MHPAINIQEYLYSSELHVFEMSHEVGENTYESNFKVTTSRRVILARGTCGGEEMCTGLWWGNLNEIDRLEDVSVDERII
jgi:hypothetical protein